MNRIGRGLMFQSVESPSINYTALALCSLNSVEKRHYPAVCPGFASKNTPSEHCPVLFIL